MGAAAYPSSWMGGMVLPSVGVSTLEALRVYALRVAPSISP